jgi:hypothetical protein
VTRTPPQPVPETQPTVTKAPTETERKRVEQGVPVEQEMLVGQERPVEPEKPDEPEAPVEQGMPVEQGVVLGNRRSQSLEIGQTVAREKASELTPSQAMVADGVEPPISKGVKRAAQLQARASTAVSERNRPSTRRALEQGGECMWMEYTRAVNCEEDDLPSEATMGMRDLTVNAIVLQLVQFHIYLVEAGLTTSQINSQWAKTHELFHRVSGTINPSVITPGVWRHPWVTAVRKAAGSDLTSAADLPEAPNVAKLAGGFCILLTVREQLFKNVRWADCKTWAAALGYIALALMYNFGWRPGQLVWTGNRAHIIGRRHLVFGIKGGAMMMADETYSSWYQRSILEIGEERTLELVDEAWFIVKSSKTTGDNKKKRSTQPKMETAGIQQRTKIERALLYDVAQTFGHIVGTQREGLIVATGNRDPQVVRQSFLPRIADSVDLGKGGARSDVGVKVITSSETRSHIKKACHTLGVAVGNFAHTSLRKAFVTGMDARAKAYADFMSKTTAGPGQWTAGSTVPLSHYIFADIQGLTSLMTDEETAGQYSAESLREMQQLVFLNNASRL